MKKSFLVFALAGLLSLPSVVLAEASWYGSMRAGWLTGQDDAGNRHAGVSDLASRWGIKGSSEASDGLTAVYRFETKINAADASSPGGRLSYVGLSGGFGQIVLGQVWSATSNHIGAMADNNWWMGHADVTGRHGNVISYSVDIGSVSMQADLTANNGKGATATRDDDDEVTMKENKSIDGSEIGATLQIGENGSVAVAHKKFDTAKGVDKRKTLIAGQYTVGGMTMHIGAGQIKTDNGEVTADTTAGTNQVTEMKTKTAFYGVRGGLGDTGVSFVLQVQSKKESGEQYAGSATTLSDLDANKRTPWTLSLTRSLGGGASVFLEHANHDEEGKKSDSVIGLAVSF